MIDHSLSLDLMEDCSIVLYRLEENVIVCFRDAESQGEAADALQVDEDGYCIRPENPMDSILCLFYQRSH